MKKENETPETIPPFVPGPYIDMETEMESIVEPVRAKVKTTSLPRHPTPHL